MDIVEETFTIYKFPFRINNLPFIITRSVVCFQVIDSCTRFVIPFLFAKCLVLRILVLLLYSFVLMKLERSIMVAQKDLCYSLYLVFHVYDEFTILCT